MKLLIGIPAFNEERVIGGVIKTLPKKIKGIKKIDILVVDDGSADRTSEIAKESKVMVVSHLMNRGLGGALKTIFTYAKLMDYDLLVTFDADGQHIGSDIKRLVKSFFDNKVDIVIGTRWKGRSKKPIVRFVVNQFANILTFLLFNIWSSDSQSGFRLFSKNAIRKIRLQTDGMEVSSEFFREIVRNKFSFMEVPINAIYTDYSLGKGQNISNSFNVMMRLLVRLLK